MSALPHDEPRVHYSDQYVTILSLYLRPGFRVYN